MTRLVLLNPDALDSVKASISSNILGNSRVRETGEVLLQRGESHIDSVDWNEVTDDF
jgi:hypothetical protein